MKLKDVTPTQHRCVVGPCPAIYESDRGTYVIVGAKIDSSLRKSEPLVEQVGSDETVVEIPKAILADLFGK